MNEQERLEAIRTIAAATRILGQLGDMKKLDRFLQTIGYLSHHNDSVRAAAGGQISRDIWQAEEINAMVGK